MTRYRIPLIVLSAAALVVFTVGFTTKHSSATSAAVAPATASALQATYINVFRKVSPSVVQIRTSSGLGSGIVFNSKGYIVTNDHVVSGVDELHGDDLDGQAAEGDAGRRVRGGRPRGDQGRRRRRASTRRRSPTPSKINVGEIAMAIGNPLGLSSSVTEGIVSALNRQEPEGNGVTLQNAIQTSAPINPGNSGGALVDIQGRVIGIPTLAAAGSAVRRRGGRDRLCDSEQHRRETSRARSRRPAT